MKPGLFISYSRRQTPFVDSLVEKLTKNEYSIWLDYHNLVPARPWFDQIMEGLNGAGAVLLIVSKDSIESTNVADEWKTALKLNKRIVLVIFETCPLPEELQNCEWVDFRVDFKKGIKQLDHLLNQPISLEKPAPQRGFKAPFLFRVALILSILVAISSIPVLWTVYIPFILIPLPWQIYKRNYNLSRVFAALILLPFMTYIHSETGTDNLLFSRLILNIDIDLHVFLIIAFLLITFFFSPVLLVILFTESMQRRATPEAAQVRFANRLIVDKRQKPRSVLFTIDHAPEDGRYADDLRKGLEKHGHRMAQINETPEAIFVLISAYKKSTNFDPDSQVVYPVILQPVSGIADNLGRIQWIDFRKGIRNIDKLAKLLPEPERLLRALATPPMNSGEIYPFVVDVLQYFFLWTGMVFGGVILMSVLDVIIGVFQTANFISELIDIVFIIINGILLFGTSLFILRGLRLRTRGASAIYPLFILAVFQLVLVICVFFSLDQMTTSGSGRSIEGGDPTQGIIAIFLYYAIFLLVAISLVLFRWRELYRWFPRYQVVPVDRIENIFLLYNPLQTRAFILHLIFHLGLLFSVPLFFLAFSFDGISVILFCVAPILFGVHWLARRLEKK
ncbi:MAG: toll/interleukin-1 receptor domain-containing protein [Anaerolineales bacterium]|nr:toll/interleukin-1 receptor domain-containing protein [Anaerolineales bacterium]